MGRMRGNVTYHDMVPFGDRHRSEPVVERKLVTARKVQRPNKWRMHAPLTIAIEATQAATVTHKVVAGSLDQIVKKLEPGLLRENLLLILLRLDMRDQDANRPELHLSNDRGEEHHTRRQMHRSSAL